MATWEDPDELIVCPYDPVHRLQRKRLQYHLIKCRQNFNPRDFKQCPFNARHVVPKPEFEYHIQICEDRGRFEAEQLQAQTQRDPNLKGNTSIPAFDPSWRPDTTESWDDDNVVYVPPSRGDILLDSEEPPHEMSPRQPSPPPPPREARPRLPKEPRDDELEHLRPPRFTSQKNAQIFQQTLQAGRGGVSWMPRPPVGRGRGRGRGLFLVPNSKQEVVVGQTRSGVATVPISSVELLDEHKKELIKKRRKLQKMLRQIERIENKTTPLLDDEVVKMGKKQQVVEQLQQLEKSGIGDE